MEQLPHELLLRVASFLDSADAINFSITGKKFLFLLHDTTSWRHYCYERSRAAAVRRREMVSVLQTPGMGRLLQRTDGGLFDALLASSNGHQALPEAASNGRETYATHVANWDPSYPTEKVDFYQEFVHRHAPISLSWFQHMSGELRGNEAPREATGAGVLYNSDGIASQLYGLLDDGRLGAWNLFPSEDHPQPRLASSGTLNAISKEGLPIPPAHPRATQRDTGVVECVSIDSQHKRGYFAVASTLFEVDLNTLKRVSSKSYVSPITALSESTPGVPLTVGTMDHVNLYDPRSPLKSMPASSERVDVLMASPKADSMAHLINTPAPGNARLSQPGPLSILNLASDEIWVAGRFTHLLSYDRRFFPRLRGTVHSGAHISCITSLPFPHVPRRGAGVFSSPAALLEAKRAPGTTLIAAGHYKGKGSLELYGLSPYPLSSPPSSDTSSSPAQGRYIMTGSGAHGSCAQNRQTASSSKLLSVVSHGLKLAVSDGNAKIKWMERDGFIPVREYTLESAPPVGSDTQSSQNAQDPTQSRTWRGLFREMPTENGDIVQKLIPTLHRSTIASSGYAPRLHEDNLIIWTGDGRLGMLGFNKRKAWDASLWEERAELAEEAWARLRLEQEHGSKMREALQWQANEARFMTGLGLPFVPG